jgi:hypothetical protein
VGHNTGELSISSIVDSVGAETERHNARGL